MKIALSLLALVLAIPSLAAQSAPEVIYAESFRHGSTHIQEDHFEIQLTPHDPEFRARIKDSHGVDRYSLSIISHGPEGDTEITAWLVKLIDLQHKMYENILLTTMDDSASDASNALWRLDPSKFALVPARATRIIKVDGFYVALRVKAFHFTPPDSPYLDSMSVFVEFTNSDPRGETVQK